MQAPFVAAEALVSSYFRDRKDVPEHGTIEICGERYVLVRAASLSVEFFSLVYDLYGPGREREASDFSRNILFDLAHAIGRSDAQDFHAKMGLADPIARLSAGPVHFALTGWAFVDILPESNPTVDEEFCLVYEHPYSFEADAWKRAGMQRDFAVCIMNAGYSSGWCEASFGMKLVSTEVSCRGAGDEQCRFIMAPPSRIEQHVERYLRAQPTKSKALDYIVPDFFARKRVEEELLRARGELETRVAARTQELRDANERLVREIGERAQIEEQLAQTRKLEAVGRLAGGIAHDFNNIMAVVVGGAGLLMRALPQGDPRRAIVEGIQAAGSHASMLTEQLLAFSRGQPRTREPLQLNTVIAKLGRMLGPLIGASIQLEVELDEALGDIEADQGQIEQVIVNLVVNARDAMPRGGTLRIATRETELDAAHAAKLSVEPRRYVELRVTDSGSGMSEAVVLHIFDPFFTTKEGSGTGLGLSTVYGIVKQSGGGIDVISEPGRGTTFALYLPRVEPCTSSRAAPPEDAAVGGTETLLVVDDKPDVRRVLADMLRGFGYAVIDSGDPREALGIVAQARETIDMLITDVIMPGMTGPQLALAAVSARPRMKLLYVSGFASEDPSRAGDDARELVLQKPFSAETLARRVRQILDQPS